MKTYIKILLFPSILIGLSCREEPTEPRTAEFSLIAEDVGVTDIYFRLKATLSHGPFTICVKRNGEQIYQSPLLNLSMIDTLLYDKNLSPKQNYTYKAYYMIGGTVHDSSAPLLVTTMDTTRHEITWEIDTLGDGNGSILRDVFILNDTNIFVVGGINVNDSLGRNHFYDLLRWNGREWKMINVNDYELTTVYAFSEDDIWVTTTAPYHWDGTRWLGYDVNGIFNGYVNKLWGMNSSNLYMVGTNGSIAYFNGTQWHKMESKTDVRLTDIFGYPDENVVWACGYDVTKAGTYLLKCTDNTWSVVFNGTELQNDIMEDTLAGTYTSVFTPTKHRIYISSTAGLYYLKTTELGKAQRYSFTNTWFPGFPNNLRGNGANDMVIVGDYSMIAHFNGITWRYFNELRTNDIALVAVAQKGDLIVAVGYMSHPWDSKGIVFIGRR